MSKEMGAGGRFDIFLDPVPLLANQVLTPMLFLPLFVTVLEELLGLKVIRAVHHFGSRF